MSQQTRTREIWFTTTQKGTRRAWYWSYAMFRAFPMPLVDAELEIMSGQATETTKPEWVGR